MSCCQCLFGRSTALASPGLRGTRVCGINPQSDACASTVEKSGNPQLERITVPGETLRRGSPYAIILELALDALGLTCRSGR